jgi:hypothetical protein
MKEKEVIQELQQLSPLLAGIGNKMPYRVPDGYWESLEERLQSVYRPEEVPTSLLQADLRQKSVFRVPDGYFESLPQVVLQKVQPQNRVVSFWQRSMLMRLAAAVVVLLLISTGLLYLLRQQNTNNPIAKGLQIKTEQQFEKELEKLDATTVVEYLKLTAPVASTHDAEALLHVAAWDDLPEEADLLDEDFLENYLNNINQTETLN